MYRQVENKVKGFRTQDGGGVSLVRVLSNATVDQFDPILMLDSFDSENYSDYMAGFPEHPHRGIETISYIYRGGMTHKDSLGNEDTIYDGEVQWMTAGSGILHTEMMPKSERLLGVQLWINLPAKDKMTSPNYHAVKKEDIKEIEIQGGKLRLLAGNYLDQSGYQGNYLPLDYYDIHLEKNSEIEIETEENRSIMLFTLVGTGEVEGEHIEEKTAVKLSPGDKVKITGKSDHNQILFISSEKLDEPVAWAGPIVMNSREELQEAAFELRNGTFIKEEAEIK